MGFLGAVMHYYKRNIGDYAKKAGRLTMLQHGSYTLLLDACYDRERFPTMEEAVEWTWASTHEELEAVRFVLSRFFTLEDGRYVQNHVREDMAEYHKNSETNRRIALEREANRKRSSTNRAPVVHEPPPNHKPLTTNQEPLTKKPKKEAKASVASFDAPEWVPAQQWSEFLVMRKAMRGVPFTEAAAKGVVKALEKLCNEGHDAASLLDTAVMNGWRTVYPPKFQQSRIQPSGETAYQRSMRERMQQAVPSIAAKAPGQQNVIEMEAFDATPRRLG